MFPGMSPIKCHWPLAAQTFGMTARDGFLADSIHEFRRLKQLADDAMAQMPAEAFARAPTAVDNSVAVIVKHVAGNLRSRWRDFLTTDGEKPDRNRDEEFEIRAADTREALLARWEEGWGILFRELGALGPADLDRTITIRREPLRVNQAIVRQLTHYAYHVGQIVYLARHLTGPSWKSLSIPKGGSAQFNQAPAPYAGNRWK